MINRLNYPDCFPTERGSNEPQRFDPRGVPLVGPGLHTRPPRGPNHGCWPHRTPVDIPPMGPRRLGDVFRSALAELQKPENFKLADKDGNGKVSRSELRTMANNAALPATLRQLANFLLANTGRGRDMYLELVAGKKDGFTLDDVTRAVANNNDGVMSAEQVKKGLTDLATSSVFDEGDMNQDTNLTREELVRLSGNPEVTQAARSVAKYLSGRDPSGQSLFAKLAGDGNVITLAAITKYLAGSADSTAMTATDVPDQKVTVGTELSLNVAGNVKPAPGKKVTFALQGPAWLKISSEGLLSGTPTAADSGEQTFTITATSDDGNTVKLVFRVAVNPAV